MSGGAGVVEIGLRPAQMEVFQCRKRFRVLAAGRRFGKTHLALLELIRAVWGAPKLAWYVAPSYKQAKRIAWARLKQMTQPFWAVKANETELSVRLVGGGVIALKGADQYQSLRGDGLDFVVLDEYASMKSECWTEVLRPALSDRTGGALFIGTPLGANHFYEQFEKAEGEEDWAAFRFTTLQGGNVRAEELESARRQLDERLYRQEFEAAFENTAVGLAYYAFSRAENVRACEFRSAEPLVWALDFNVHPMCSVVAQRTGGTVDVLDEMVLDNANTRIACEAFHARAAELLARTTDMWGRRQLQVEVYGDASGHQRRTSGTDTDWGLIKEYFRAVPEIELRVRAGVANPGVRDRVNTMNSLLCTAAGERRLVIDPRCRELITDLERVRWMLDAAGRPTVELDKTDRKRTHISDALGYYVAATFPVGLRTVGERREGRLV